MKTKELIEKLIESDPEGNLEVQCILNLGSLRLDHVKDITFIGGVSKVKGRYNSPVIVEKQNSFNLQMDEDKVVLKIDTLESIVSSQIQKLYQDHLDCSTFEVDKNTSTGEREYYLKEINSILDKEIKCWEQIIERRGEPFKGAK